MASSGYHCYLDPKSNRWLHPSIRCGASAEGANGTGLFQWNLSRTPLRDARLARLCQAKMIHATVPTT